MQHDTHSYVLNSLGSRIAAGDLPESTVLTLTGLEEEYQVSRTVIREAVRVLESHGMLVSRRRVGITVQPITSWDLLDGSVIQWRLAGPERDRQLVELTQLRAGVEPVAARLAAEHASPEQCENLIKLAAMMRSLAEQGRGSSPEFLEADIAFHTVVLEASRSLLLARMAGPIIEVITSFAVVHLRTGAPLARSVTAHAALAHAIQSGDVEAAGEACVVLLAHISEEITQH